MFDVNKKTIREEAQRKNKKGYQIIIKDLDSGEEVVNCQTKAIIGAYETKSPIGGATAANGIIVTSCNTATIMGVIEAADNTVTEAKKKVIGDLPPEVLLAALLSGGSRE